MQNTHSKYGTKTVIPIWIKPSKSRSRCLESGERITIDTVRKAGRRNRKLVIERQFYSYPDWQTIESVSFTINRGVLCKLKDAITETMKE